MDDYNFWRNVFDTYQSLSDWMTFAWLALPPIFLLGLCAVLLHYRLASGRAGAQIPGDLVYTVHRDEFGRFQVYRHGSQPEQHPPIMMP